MKEASELLMLIACHVAVCRQRCTQHQQCAAGHVSALLLRSAQQSPLTAASTLARLGGSPEQLLSLQSPSAQPLCMQIDPLQPLRQLQGLQPTANFRMVQAWLQDCMTSLPASAAQTKRSLYSTRKGSETCPCMLVWAWSAALMLRRSGR